MGLQEYYDNFATQSSRWADEDASVCACRGSGWFISELDTEHQCPFHYEGQPSAWADGDDEDEDFEESFGPLADENGWSDDPAFCKCSRGWHFDGTTLTACLCHGDSLQAPPEAALSLLPDPQALGTRLSFIQARSQFLNEGKIKGQRDNREGQKVFNALFERRKAAIQEHSHGASVELVTRYAIKLVLDAAAKI